MASRRTAPLNGHEVSREDVVDLANHITLPPNLPTSEEDQPAVIEQNMIHLAQAAITSMDATSSQAWSRVSDMLLKLNSIKKMREYDYSVLGRELSRMRRDVLKPLPPLDAAPEFAPPPQSRISQDATEIPSLTPTNKLKGDLIVVLAGVEKWVKVNLGPWTEQTLLSPDTQAFNKLANLIRDYWLLAESAYARNPLESSLALLTILELWVTLDKLCVEEIGLLKKYSPQIPLDLLEPLLLPKSEQMCRLDLVEKYIRSRTENSQQQGSGIFVTPTQECFSICYFNSSSQLQALCRKILRIDQEKRQEKAEAQAMKIEIYEDALPRDEVQKKAAVFEIAIPKSFAAWRDSTWLIIHGAGRSAYKSALTKNISIGIWDYKPLQRFGKPVENHRVTLASSTKPFLDGQSRSVCFPVDFGRVCVLNSLQYDTWDRTGRCWPSHIAEPPSLKERCTLSLPSGPYFKLDWASKTSQHTTNEVMSNQYLCDKSLKIQEHIAFCNLRAGERLQSLNILRELGSNNLNQNDPAVTVLVQQAIWEAGSPSQDCFRNAHVEFRLGTMVGLRSRLVLRDEALPGCPAERRVLIPCGIPKIENNGYHVNVTIGDEESPKRDFFVYRVDRHLQKLRGVPDLRSQLLKAYLHAVTAYVLPDPFTHVTGTEEAIETLGEASLYASTSLTEQEMQLLNAIATLTPQHTYSRQHRICSQKIFWDARLSPLVQHDDFYLAAQAIFLQHTEAQVLVVPASACKLSLRSGGDQFLASRARQRNASVTKSGLFVKLVTSDGDDKVCTARDLYGWVERAIHVHEIASLIRDWPATLPVTTDLVTVVKEWQEVYGYHGTFVTTSLQEVVDLKLSSHWGSLYDLCRSANRETGTYALMFTFCSIAFGVDKKQMSLLRTMLAFAFNDVFRTIDPPKVHNAYNLIHGTTISREVISSAIRIEVPRPKKARSNCLPMTKARYARIQHEYDTEIPRLLDLIWSRRSDQRIRVPRDEHFGYLADYTSTIIKECERVIAECQKNKLFIEHIQAVEAELKKMTARSIQQQMPNAHLRIPHRRNI
ncbi:unnamed protein product [Aureobasidium pullulans]|nr:unnamed protein product [Aureobasidium pullulans]